MSDNSNREPLAPATGSADPDLGPISRGHVCKHGVRWPHECKPCADASWELHLLQSQNKDSTTRAKLLPIGMPSAGNFERKTYAQTSLVPPDKARR